MQRKHIAKRVVLVLAVTFTMSVVALAAVYNFQQTTATALNGRISASISTSHYTDALRNELAYLIGYAERLIGDTCESLDGSDIPHTRYWASPTAHDLFQSAIDSARDTFASTRHLFPGDTLTSTIRIDDNTGFAGMLLRIRIPEGLELINVQVYDHMDIEYGLELPSCANDILPTASTPLREDVFLGWVGRSYNFYGNGSLFTLTFRVTSDATAGQTVPIMIAFANGTPAYELPTDENDRELQMSIQGRLLDLGASAEIGRVAFGHFAQGLSINVAPNSRTIINRVGESVDFNFTVTGMPPNQYFCISHPICLLGSYCLAYFDKGQDAGITIDGFPEFLAVSGYIRTNANGAGANVFTVEIVDADTSVALEFEFGGVIFSSN